MSKECYFCKKPFSLAERIWFCYSGIIGRDSIVKNANDKLVGVCIKCFNGCGKK